DYGHDAFMDIMPHSFRQIVRPLRSASTVTEKFNILIPAKYMQRRGLFGDLLHFNVKRADVLATLCPGAQYHDFSRCPARELPAAFPQSDQSGPSVGERTVGSDACPAS